MKRDSSLRNPTATNASVFSDSGLGFVLIHIIDTFCLESEKSIEQKKRVFSLRPILPCLKYQSSTFRLLITTKLKVLASLQCQLCLGFTNSALQSQDNFLRSFGFFVEYGLRLTTVSGLFAVITTLPLGK
jgi:hypothetical protein